MHIVVHAGPPKAASSSIQTALEDNREALLASGISYLEAADPFEWSLVSLYRGPEAPVPGVLADRFATQDALRAWSADAWRNLETQLDRAGTDMAVISSEHFHAVADKPALVARLRRRADRLSFVAYARDPVDQFTSDCDQGVRAGLDFARGRKPWSYRYTMAGIRDYAPLLDADALLIRSFRPGDLAGGDVVADFFQLLSRLSGRDVRARMPISRENESLGAAITLWLLSTNALGPFRGEARARRAALVDALREDETLKDLPKLRMTDPVIASAVRYRNRETIAWLNAGPLAHSPLETAPEDSGPLQVPELTERLRNWYLSHGREDHMRRVIAAVTRHAAAIPG